MKNPHDIIIKPRITEKTVLLSQGDPRVRDDEQQVRTYTFEVATSANKIEIKAAIEAIYNEGKKDKEEKIEITKVRTVSMKGKSRRISMNRRPGKKKDWKKAMVTLAKGQYLEDYGV
ncbi:MAG: 50S ribosomal protein L23 [Fimbriimonadaceae bacterium]|nr:50S ribosomal protein L23 [Fimbriimonadaceae bacterium]